MSYQTNDTQPERTSMAWSRTRWATLLVTLIECRLMFGQESLLAGIGVVLAALAFLAGLLLANRRKRHFRAGLRDAYFTGSELGLLLLQVLVLAGLGLVAVFGA